MIQFFMEYILGPVEKGSINNHLFWTIRVSIFESLSTFFYLNNSFYT